MNTNTLNATTNIEETRSAFIAELEKLTDRQLDYFIAHAMEILKQDSKNPEES